MHWFYCGPQTASDRRSFTATRLGWLAAPLYLLIRQRPDAIPRGTWGGARNCSMRSRNSLLVAAADNRGTEISAKESAANNMGIGLIVQGSDRHVGMLPDLYRYIRRQWLRRR
jgi:hypothetical protein